MNLSKKEDVVLCFLDKLDVYNGDVLKALDESGLKYSEHLELMKDEGYRQAVDYMNQKRILLAERTVVSNAVNGDQRAAEYILNNQGKLRGWGNNAVLEMPFNINLNLYLDGADEEDETIDGEIIE